MVTLNNIIVILGRPNPYNGAVKTIIKGNAFAGNILECLDTLNSCSLRTDADLLPWKNKKSQK